jgi:hypothetical protein
VALITEDALLEDLRRELIVWRWLRWVIAVAALSIVVLSAYYEYRLRRDIAHIAELARQDASLALILEDVRAAAYARHSATGAIGVFGLAMVLVAWRRTATRALVKIIETLASQSPHRGS